MQSFAKIKSSRKFPNLQYSRHLCHSLVLAIKNVYSCTTDKNVWDFSLGQESYLAHVILPRLSRKHCSLAVLELTHMFVKWCQCLVKSDVIIASQHIQELLKAYFKIKSPWWARKRIHYLCEGGKSVPHDHHFHHSASWMMTNDDHKAPSHSW